MRKSTLVALLVGAALMLILAACGGQTTEEPKQSAPAATQEMMKNAESGHDESQEEADHGGDDHGVAGSDEAMPNPIEATEASVARGAEAYAKNCAVCHGDTGLGDGVAGKSLDPPPANLHEDHVQILTDGAMFAIIHNGVEGTGMPAFEGVVEEDDIWRLVNFIRTFQEN